MLKKIKERISKAKVKIASVMILGSSVMSSSTISVSAGLGDNAQKGANTANTEIIGLAEVVGLLGVLACGVLVILNKRDVAKIVGMSVLGGYFILKYAQPIWDIIKNGI